MADTQANTNEMTQEQAIQTLAFQVHHPMFFNKLAQSGYVPADATDAEDYLKLAVKLRMLGQVNPSQPKQSLLKQATNDLDQVLSKYYTGQQSVTDQEIKMAALQAIQVPELGTAAIKLAESLAT